MIEDHLGYNNFYGSTTSGGKNSTSTNSYSGGSKSAGDSFGASSTTNYHASSSADATPTDPIQDDDVTNFQLMNVKLKYFCSALIDFCRLPFAAQKNLPNSATNTFPKFSL